jgi:hypothetical protein
LTGEITDKFLPEDFHDERPPHFIADIDWSPDGTKLAVVGMEMNTVHYPEDVWIIRRKELTAKKVTNSTLYSKVAEDDATITFHSIYYESPK